MNINEVPQNSATFSAIDRYLDQYMPANGYFGHWPRLREEVLNLVRSMEPKTREIASVWLTDIGRVLVAEAPFHPETGLDGLLTDMAITRLAALLNDIPGSRASKTQVVRNLTQLHRRLKELPPVIPSPLQDRGATVPVRQEEIEQLIDLSKNARNRAMTIELQILRRIIMARIAGLCGEKADAAKLIFDGERLIAIYDVDGSNRPLALKEMGFLLELATPALEKFITPSSWLLSIWMKKFNLAYFWPRLRDDYLVEMTDGSEPALVQLRKYGSTRHDMQRLEFRWANAKTELPVNELRIRSIYVESECELESRQHDLWQPHKAVRPEKDSGSAMNASTRKKPSKAATRRSAAEYRELTSSTSNKLSKDQTSYVTRFVCKSAKPEDREIAKQAFASVMNRAVHIKSMANFRKNATAVSGLVAWAIVMERSLDWQDLMSHEFIHEYTRYWQESGYTDNTAHELRNLKLLASNINPGLSAPPRVQAIGHKAVADPYSAADMAAIVQVATTQTNPKITRQLAFIIAACRGAGVGAFELRELTEKSVEDKGDEGIFITAGKDGHKRTVPVRKEWEEMMRAGIAGLKPSSLAIGTVKNRRNIAGEVFDRTISLGSTCPKLDASRLRTTYIAELMSEAIPIKVILAATGLKSARTLTDIAMNYTQTEMNEHFGVLRGVA